MAVPILLEGGAVEWAGDGNGAGSVALVDQGGNPLAQAPGALVGASKYALPIAGFDEDILRMLRVGRMGGMALNRVNMPLFQDLVDGAAVNTQQWTQTLTTMTATQANRVVTLNANNTVTITTVATHTSIAQFSKPREGVLRLSARMRLDWQAAGATLQFGFALVSTTTEQVNNGIFARVTTAGNIDIVIAQNNADVATKNTGVSVGAGADQVNPSRWYDVDLFVMDDAVRLVIQASDGDTATAPVVDSTLGFTLTQPADSIPRALPVTLRVLNVTAPATAARLFYSGVVVVQQDIDERRSIQHAMARVGRGGILNPASGAQLANYANSAAPASATLSNTAAGYTTLGGQWQFAAVAGAETDYALFGFAVPAGYALHITGVRIDTTVTGAAVATTATLLQWFVGRANAVTLASNSFRKAIGMQTLPVGAAIGSLAAPIDHQFDVPFVVDSGQTFHLGLKMPVGTATASSVIRGVACIDGYLE